jgi:hypothetical protein
MKTTEQLVIFIMLVLTLIGMYEEYTNTNLIHDAILLPLIMIGIFWTYRIYKKHFPQKKKGTRL